ncbi:hypothetical protein HBH92_177680 [Parastagonospora nodorum]|nr:hypothetical protein HBH51_159000 [Parastagonospora nodorum]KAH4022707.1 hypothetical protein HBI09_166570 [Parastagonospora nodorum]KAH4133126.1 hypothetical protein HBH47_002700 [Parastagonospora nodorum]KAH4187937.1 hypothetical protein HBH42_152280 [Parastagonospora nodorum]KAH4260332.1 hypothetical protein HBI03_125800 [Parastagonospora nodorum]
MSMIACSIVDLDDNPDASKWYLETHVPRVVAKLGGTAYSASKMEENVFPDMASIEGQYITRYELPEGTDAKAAESHISTTSEKLPLSAKIETRMYERQETWYGEGWRGHIRDIQFFQMAFWQTSEAVRDDFVGWLRDDFFPNMADSPELIRMSIFKLKHASISQNGNTEQMNPENMYQYMGVWELIFLPNEGRSPTLLFRRHFFLDETPANFTFFLARLDNDEVPWDALVYLGTSEKWRMYWEAGQVQWQARAYHVNRFHPEEKRKDSPTTR